MQTDILGGVQLGYKTILTLSGISTLEKLKDYSYRPDLVVNSIAELDLDLLLKEGVNEKAIKHNLSERVAVNQV